MTTKELALQQIAGASHFLENGDPLNAFCCVSQARSIDPNLYILSGLQAIRDEASRAISMDLCLDSTVIRFGRIVDADLWDREMLATMDANGGK